MARQPDVDFAALDALLVRVFGPRADFDYRRTETGSSTQVYRLRRGGEVFYVRIAETEPDAMAPEAAAHEWLRAAGVAVPEVVHLEPYDQRLRRSVLVTGEIPGRPAGELGGELGGEPAGEPVRGRETGGLALAEVHRAAGRDLARLHRCPVRGFGWVLREHGRPGWPITAEHDTHAEFVRPTTTVATLADLSGGGLEAVDLDLVEKLLGEMNERAPAGSVGRLAHGDLDPTHIFAGPDGYTGLIDFGEIRGTAYTFDLATMWLESTAEGWPEASRELERGYAEEAALPDDHERQVYLACVHSVASRVARWLDRDGPAALERPYPRRLLDQMIGLLRRGSR